MSDKVAIFGAGGHGLMLGAILIAGGGKVFFLDDRMDALSSVEGLGAMLVGGSEKLEDPRFLRRHDLLVALGDNYKRRQFTELAIKNGANMSILVDPNAIVVDGTALDSGCTVMAMAVVSQGVVLGKSVIVDIGAIITHGCVIGDYANICPGVRLLGEVTVGEMAFIGGGAIVMPRLKIGRRAVVGAGAVVTKDVPDGATVVGNPARVISHTDSKTLLPDAGNNIIKVVPRS